MPPQMYMEAANVVPMKNRRPMAPPNSGPRLREIMKYGPPAGTTPLVAMALMLIAVSIVCLAANKQHPLFTLFTLRERYERDGDTTRHSRRTREKQSPASRRPPRGISKGAGKHGPRKPPPLKVALPRPSVRKEGPDNEERLGRAPLERLQGGCRVSGELGRFAASSPRVHTRRR